jgi:hypothetical protein
MVVPTATVPFVTASLSIIHLARHIRGSCPAYQLMESGPGTLAEIGQTVVDTRGNFGEDLALHNTSTF